MNKIKDYLLLIVLFFTGTTLTFWPLEGKELKFSSNHWLPWIIIQKNNINPVQMTGIDIEIIRGLASRLNLTLKLDTCPWKRCLELLRFGHIDILNSVYKRPEREEYLSFIEPEYYTSSVRFYIQGKSGPLIRSYEDLYKTSIGVVNGAKYFPRFDNDNKIDKQSVLSHILLLRMLKLKRFGAFIGQEMTMDYLILEKGYKGYFQKSPYRFVSQNKHYLALSKKSAFINAIPQFNKVLQNMLEEGKIKRIFHKYIQ